MVISRRERLKKRRRLILVIVLALLILAGCGLIVRYYTTQLALSLKGSEKETVGLYSIYKDEGVKAKLRGSDATEKVKVSGAVDTSKPGEYVLRYTLSTLSVKRTVTVEDKMNPELVLTGERTMEMSLGDKYSEPGYKAVDEKGKDITDKVKVSGADFMKAGEQKVIYTVKDNKGKTTRVYRNVNIAPNTNYDSPGVPICMYHYVYDENNPPDDLNQRFGNYISMQDLEEELNWLNKEGYYYPTWKEMRDYAEGRQLLPEKSIVLSFDDGAMSFLQNGIPVLEKCKVPATCFMITSSDGENKIAQNKSKYVTYQSHTNNMHRPGGNVGHGGIFTAISHDEGLADLKESIRICGSSDALAYPYGDYNDSSKGMVKEAGFLCAVTTQYGKAFPGDDPLLLPRVRMVMGQSLNSFINSVSP